MPRPKKQTSHKKERLIAVIPSGKRESSSADMIYDVVRQIPRGRVTTYGAIAKLLDLPNARMVGHAMRSVDDKGRAVPAQRVVTRPWRYPETNRNPRTKDIMTVIEWPVGR